MLKMASPAAERNKDPILSVLRTLMPSHETRVLEIGSGTGQHAVYFAGQLPQVLWTTSDLAIRHRDIKAWMDDAKRGNVSGPLEIEIGKHEIPVKAFDIVYVANVLHIVSWEKVKCLAEMLGRSQAVGSQLAIYGPFNYEGKFTSESNQEFDASLRANDPKSGIRDFEEISRILGEQGFDLVKDHAMPANNRFLHFKRVRA